MIFDFLIFFLIGLLYTFIVIYITMKYSERKLKTEIKLK